MEHNARRLWRTGGHHHTYWNFNFCRLIGYYVSRGENADHWWQCYSSCSWQGHCFLLHFRRCRVVSGNLHVAATPLFRRRLQLLAHRLTPLYMTGTTPWRHLYPTREPSQQPCGNLKGRFPRLERSLWPTWRRHQRPHRLHHLEH